MSLESDIKTMIVANATITAIIPSTRIFTKEDVGRDGLTSDATPAIFDGDGDLLPSILISELDKVPDGQVIDYDDKDFSVIRTAEIYYYQERVYGTIDQVAALVRETLWGEIVEDSFELEMTLEVPRLRDEAALAGASVIRQTWSTTTIL